MDEEAPVLEGAPAVRQGKGDVAGRELGPAAQVLGQLAGQRL